MILLDGLLGVLLAGCLVIAVTGGAFFQFGNAKLEASSLDPWVAIFSLLLLVRYVAAGRVPSPVWFWLRRQLADLSVRPRAAARFLVLVFAALVVAHIFRHLSFGTDAFDLTFVHQSLYNAFATPALHCDVCDSETYFGEHLTFSLFALAPLATLFRNFLFHDWVLFMVEGVLLALPAWIAIRRGPLAAHARLWLVAAILMVSNRAFRNAGVWDLREDHLAFAGLLLAAVSIASGRVWAYAAALGFALVSKENVAWVTPAFAVPILFLENLGGVSRERRRRIAVLTVVVSIAWAVVQMKWLMPLMSAGRESTSEVVKRFPEYGSTPAEVAWTLLTSPAAWWSLVQSRLLQGAAIKYLVLLCLTALPFARSAWMWLVPAIPGLAMNLLSSAETQRSMQFHYDLVILPFLFMAILTGLASWQRRGKLSDGALGMLVLLALATSGRWPGHSIQKHRPTPAQASDSLALARLSLGKDGATEVVGASSRVLAQLSAAREQRLLGFPPQAPAIDALTGIAGRSYRDATLFVLDLSQPAEREFHDEQVASGAQGQPLRPGSSLVLLRRR